MLTMRAVHPFYVAYMESLASPDFFPEGSLHCREPYLFILLYLVITY